MTRVGIVEQLLNLEVSAFPISIPSVNLDKDYESFYRILSVRKLTKTIGMTKDPDRGLLWFRLRK